MGWFADEKAVLASMRKEAEWKREQLCKERRASDRARQAELEWKRRKKNR